MSTRSDADRRPKAPGPAVDDNGAAGAGYEPGFGIPDQKVLADLSHELGNYFHKLYYWTDYLRSQDSRDADRAPWEMLEGTVLGLESLLRMTLEYFAPVKLSFIKLAVAELFAGSEKQLPGRRLRVEGLEQWRETVVLADPARLHHVFRTVVERVGSTLIGDEDLIVRLQAARRDEFRGLEIDFAAGSGSGKDDSLISGIGMSVADKFLKVHGGELFERGQGDAISVVIFLPLYQ